MPAKVHLNPFFIRENHVDVAMQCNSLDCDNPDLQSFQLSASSNFYHSARHLMAADILPPDVERSLNDLNL